MNSTVKFCLSLFACSIFALCMHTRTSAKEFEVISLIDKKTYSKPTNGMLEIKGKIGKTTVIWDNGGVRISDSCCPNKTCVSMGRTTNSAIICIPNGIMVKPKFSEYDAITQ